MADRLDSMTREELLAEAEKRGLRGVKDKPKAAIKRALREDDGVQELREQTEAAEGQLVDESVEEVPEPESNAEAPAEASPTAPALTAHQVTRLRTARREEIESVLSDPNLPKPWRVEFKAELDRRDAQAKSLAEAEKRKSPVNQWEVTKGGRFVIAGRVTSIPTGSVITDQTHNLDEVRAQGIEIVPFDGVVEVFRNQMGAVSTRLVRNAPKPEEPGGEAPRP